MAAICKTIFFPVSFISESHKTHSLDGAGCLLISALGNDWGFQSTQAFLEAYLSQLNSPTHAQ